MDGQRAEGAGTEPGCAAAEGNGVRLSMAIDPRLAEVWTTLFAAGLDAEDLSEQVGWFLRMAYLRGYHDGLCEPEAGSLYRELGVRVPAAPPLSHHTSRHHHRKESQVIIDCRDCEMHESEHCSDCFVMALLAPRDRPVVLDPEEEEAFANLQEAGLAPPLKFRRRAG